MPPFFTIVMPTRGRPDLIAHGIASVMQQGFADYEFILVDNSDDHLTAATWFGDICPHVDARFSYARTGGLCLSDNFEFAFSLARGRHVITLIDKAVLNVDALQRLHDTLTAGSLQLLMFHDLVMSEPLPAGPFAQLVQGERHAFGEGFNSGRVSTLESRALAQTVMAGGVVNGASGTHYTPRCYNTVYSRGLLDQVRGRFGRLFGGIDVDCRLAFEAMDLLPTVVHLDLAVNARYIGGGNSNAIAFASDFERALAFITSQPAPVRLAYARAPCGALPLTHLVWYFEWLATISAAQGALQGLTMKHGHFWPGLISDAGVLAAGSPQSQGMVAMLQRLAAQFDPQAAVEWSFEGVAGIR